LPQLPGQTGPVAQASGGAVPGTAGTSDTAGTPGAAPDAAAPADAVDLRKLYEHLRRGVVAVERGGAPVAIGTVLGGDGRVLTALSPLAGSDSVDIRYADGTAVHAKVGESDTAMDLALLVPKSAKWTDGLGASEADPTGAALKAMLPSVGKGGVVGPALAGVKGVAEAHARDGQALLNLLDIDLKGAPIAGAPLIDGNGDVVAVLVRECKGAAADDGAGGATGTGGAASATRGKSCVPAVFGAPVTALRSFLSHAPAAQAAAPGPAPWLGIRGEPEASGNVRGVRVTAVAPSSPAEKAGLKPSSDVIVAVDGKPIDTPEKLAEAIGKHVPGDSVKLLVYGGDKFRESAVALKTAP
jgi:serine protease Do